MPVLGAVVLPEAGVVEAAGLGAAVVVPEAVVVALEADDAEALGVEALPTLGFWAAALGLNAADDVVGVLAAPFATLVDFLSPA